MRRNRIKIVQGAYLSAPAVAPIVEACDVLRRPSHPGLLGQLTREGHILWGFGGGDVTAAVVPALCFTMAALPSLFIAPRIMAVALVYFTCFELCFSIANQLTSLDEDRVNKPRRPLVQGLLTVRGGWVRWGVITLLCLGLGMQAHALLPTLGWIGIALTSAFGWDRAWMWKQAMMVLGCSMQLYAAWHLAVLLSPVVLPGSSASRCCWEWWCRCNICAMWRATGHRDAARCPSSGGCAGAPVFGWRVCGAAPGSACAAGLDSPLVAPMARVRTGSHPGKLAHCWAGLAPPHAAC